ncbi:MAG TPA: efflux RND transporter periplasmic adaptor subunit [Vicinamibacteria bacterium]|nr:efflux RND transporter periplasmic adaptor subunit [Vicinamibacteria bacterium]
MTRRHLFLISLAAAMAAAACDGTAQTAAESKPRGVPVRTVTVQQRDLQDEVVLTGTLRPRAQVQVVAEVPARLLQVRRDEGARAARGEVLAVLDPTDYRLSADRARASQAVAAANQAHAGVERERADSLLKTGGITDKDRLAAQVNLQVAEAALAQARAETSIAEQQLARTEIRAPFNGRVARRMADPGAMLAVGTPLFTFVDDSVLEFRASAPSTQYGKVRVGSPVKVTVDSMPGLAVTGRVVRIAPLVDDRSRSFDTVVEVPGNPALVGGLFARATIEVGRLPSALVVPPAALVRDGTSQAQAFVIVQGKAERRTVAVGVEGADAVQVTSGLQAGDVLVLDPPVALSSGSPVEVQAARK